MARKSAPIAVAAATPVEFTFGRRESVNYAYVFYTDLAGSVGNEVAIGSGTRDVTATMLWAAHAGTAQAATDIESDLEIGITGGTTTDLPGRTTQELELGDGAQRLRFVAVAKSTPGGALTYRVVLDVEAAP